MKVGDKIVCIDKNAKGLALTAGKIYTVTENYHPYTNGVQLINDLNEKGIYHTSRFVEFNEYRKLKLKKIDESRR